MRRKIKIAVSLFTLAGALVFALIFVLLSHNIDFSSEKILFTSEKDSQATTSPNAQAEISTSTKNVDQQDDEEVANIPKTSTTSAMPPKTDNKEVAPIIKPTTVVPSTPTVWKPLTAEDCAESLNASPFFLDPAAVVTRIEREQRAEGNIVIADELREISCHPQAIWLTWKDAQSTQARVFDLATKASEAGKIAVFVVYNSPDHSSTKWWVGNNGQDYLDWITAIAKAVDEREVWFIIEPDALGLSTDYSEEDREYRTNELKEVVSLFKTHAPNSKVYLDAGHNKWKTPEIFSQLLLASGIEQADGFALNISNYQRLEDEIARGEAVSNILGGKHFIIDTSRNGLGAPVDNEWCNASGRALGAYPTTETASVHIDAYLWVKPPGESDGTCNGGPTPGKFWLNYGLMLVKNAIDLKK